MSPLTFAERPAAGHPAGLVVLHHGRGTSERDLLPLADILDPDRRLLFVAPRAPLRLPGSPGYHWYQVPRVGHPDPDTFDAAYRALAGFHDELWQRTGLTPGQTVLGGFSMGSAMSYALGLGPDRPAPAGILAFSGFIPTLDGWAPDLAGRTAVRAFVAHGRRDPVIVVDLAHRAVEVLEAAGIDVVYHESGVGHQIAPDALAAAGGWLSATLGP
ncbi:MAG TPA: phospholipase [Solirubrobacteraceae bacterium]|nr:phospholipase [Solirubrobacteraceae bacterium]